MSKKSLLIISPGFPKDETDTTCLPTVQSFIHCINKNYPHLNLVILAVEYPYTDKEYVWFKNKVIPCNGKRFPKILRPVLWLRAYRKTKQFLRETTIVAILNLWYLESAMIGEIISRRKKIRALTWIHGQDARRTNPYVSLLKINPERLIAISSPIQKEFKTNFNLSPKYIIENAVDPDSYEGKALIPFGSRDVDILGVGSLIPLKNFAVFIDVVVDLAQKEPNLKCVICGAGPEFNKLSKKIESLGLSRNITLAGEKDHNSVLELMNRSKILLHPSSYEGYSTVCLEALYSGCFVVSSIAAEDQEVEHWTIAASKDEMVTECLRILNDESDAKRILVHDMNNTVRKMITLLIQEIA